jgi:hypothetical protein
MTRKEIYKLIEDMPCAVPGWVAIGDDEESAVLFKKLIAQPGTAAYAAAAKYFAPRPQQEQPTDQGGDRVEGQFRIGPENRQNNRAVQL